MGQLLMSCPDCARAVSKRAKACPGCGAPLAPADSEGGGTLKIFAGMLFLPLVIWATYEVLRRMGW